MKRKPSIALAIALVLSGCGQSVSSPATAPGVTLSSITLTSRSFTANGSIPIDYTCDGKDVSPQMTWSSPPEGTKSFAVVAEDVDAATGAFTHWLMFNVPAESTSLAEAVDPKAIGAQIGLNDFENTRYGGPCPPHGQAHRYRFYLYALDRMLGVSEGANRAIVDDAMHGHVLGVGAIYVFFSH